MDNLPDGVESILERKGKTYYRMPMIPSNDGKCFDCSFSSHSVETCQSIKRVHYLDDAGHNSLPCIVNDPLNLDRKDYVFVGKSRYKEYFIKILVARLEGTL